MVWLRPDIFLMCRYLTYLVFSCTNDWIGVKANSELRKIIIYVQYLILSMFELLKGFQCQIINLPDIIQFEQMEINHETE